MKKILIAVSIFATVTTATAKTSKKKRCAQKEPCKLTYDEIREQLRDEEITLEEAQKLWIKHREQEEI